MMVASASSSAAENPGAGAERKLYPVPCTWKGDSELIVKRYKICLNSENQGVVEASLAHVLWIRLAAPCVDVTPLKSEIERLSVEGSNASVRFKAYMVAVIFEDPEQFKTIASQGYDDSGQLFGSVTRHVAAASSGDLYTSASASR
jgi:hypothetical protein